MSRPALLLHPCPIKWLWTGARLEVLTQAGLHLFMGISLTWWFPVNKSWKIKGNLSILCLVLSNNHNYFQNKTKQRPLEFSVTFKALPNYIFPTTISRQQKKPPCVCAEGPYLSSRPYFTSSRHIKWNIWEKNFFSHVFFSTIMTLHSCLPWLVGQCQHGPSRCIFVRHFEEKRCHRTITGMFQTPWTFLNKSRSCSLQRFSVIR